ncbi:MAG: ChpI protein [bacterium]|nr:ChpI protein [bacterium]
MKIAVSIPDTVYEAAERLAARRRCSRSSLYAEALERLLAQEDSEEVTARLNAVYSEEPSKVSDELLEAQGRALNERW